MCRRREWKTITHFGTGMIEGKILYLYTTLALALCQFIVNMFDHYDSWIRR
jgi:hypothetical protein